MHARFSFYVVACVVGFLALLLLLLLLFGVIHPSYQNMSNLLDDRLTDTVSYLERDVDALAADALAFSGQVSNMVEQYLAFKGVTFEQLRDNPDALIELQGVLYATVYGNLRIAGCSGAFCVLDTTVNSGLSEAYCNGLYLKYANLYAQNNVNTDVSLYRGAAPVARANDINLHSSWDYEMRTDFFSDPTSFSNETPYRLSPIQQLSGTWDRARYVYAPVYGQGDSLIGVCGFEISDLYFKLTHFINSIDSEHVVCGLAEQTDTGYAIQFGANRSGYSPQSREIEVYPADNDLFTVIGEEDSFVGKLTEVTLGGRECVVVALVPEAQYQKECLRERIKLMGICLGVGAVAVAVCLWISRLYIRPVRAKIERYKAGAGDELPSGVHEIDDLFRFLAMQDRENELAREESEQQLRDLRESLHQVSVQYLAAQRDNARLAYLRKQEVDPDAYQTFLDGLATLSPMERTVLGYYLEGKGVKEIVDIAAIKESTVRFHNRNIYSKLGVTSLKQLLRYAAILRQSTEDAASESL